MEVTYNPQAEDSFDGSGAILLPPIKLPPLDPTETKANDYGVAFAVEFTPVPVAAVIHVVPISDHTQAYSLTIPANFADGFTVYTAPFAADDILVTVSAPGYATFEKKASDLQLSPKITLHKPGNGIMAMLALAALITFAQKRKKEVGSVGVGDVMPFLLIGGGLLAFSIVKTILEKLGIWDSHATVNLDAASTDPNSFWNPNFWQLKPANEPWTYLITEGTAAQWCYEIYDALGVVNDDEEAVTAVFKRCRTQANASFLCWKFDKMYQEDLLQWLRGGIWPTDRLSDSDVYAISSYISHLPKY